MVELYFITNRNGNTEIATKQNLFIDEVLQSAKRARVAENKTANDWDFGFLQSDDDEAFLQKYFAKKFQYPSVAVNYDGGKWVYLRGLGNPQAWEAMFRKLFRADNVIEQVEKGNGGDRDQEGTPDGDGNGGNGNNISCLINNALETLGLLPYKKNILLGGAAYLGFKAVSAEKTTEQALYGGGAAYLAYKALSESDEKC